MGEVSVKGSIAASPDKVWAILRDFGNLEWGGISGTKLEGEGVGAIRIFKTSQGDLVVRERLEALDDLGHSLTYSIMEPAGIPWTGHLARIQLAPEEGGTRITWSGRFEPKTLTEDQVAAIVRGIFENGIRNLKRACES
jgi:hypothetical protein